MDIIVKTIKTGNSVPVILPGMGTAGFQWFYSTENGDCIEIKPYDYTQDSLVRDAGTSNDEVFMITGVLPGHAKVTFEQRRGWEKNGQIINTQTFDITVTQ
ncbi:protease inhibitor I42 family protein [Chitinophaga varians]|uniref:protease inhibitor I42 family protein n=1 Tax=Chitinophaga varians TaxID=2202339 RepID=UPI00165F45C7|nr:protease inhibitor I42 family protein [Chitinophaga varians]MBC9912793.1 protease inhibitor I42 family protein [Chitinophaga varians]